MRHLKKFNEASIGYHRTMGFQYSDPSEKYSVTCIYSCPFDVTESLVSSALEETRVKYDNIEFHPVPEDFESEDGFPNPDGMFQFYIYVYNEREIEAIMTTFEKYMQLENNLVLHALKVREIGKKSFD